MTNPTLTVDLPETDCILKGSDVLMTLTCPKSNTYYLQETQQFDPNGPNFTKSVEYNHEVTLSEPTVIDEFAGWVLDKNLIGYAYLYHPFPIQGEYVDYSQRNHQTYTQYFPGPRMDYYIEK